MSRPCSHPHLRPTQWNQPKPEPAEMIGCEHNYACPVCGYGAGMVPDPCHKNPVHRALLHSPERLPIFEDDL